MGVDAYQYSALKSEDLVRVITLEPGEFDDDLIIQIRSAPFEEAVRVGYTALSYVWGDESDPEPVYVRDGTMLWFCDVTRNLEVALRYLRERNLPLQLWVDALCINQADNGEKSTQVGRMGNIYRQASRVVAWLGPPSTRSTKGLEWLWFFGTEIEYNSNTDRMWPAENATDPELGDPLAVLYLDLDLVEAVVDILERRWFRRVWIRQEIRLANARQAVVQCGDMHIPWLDIQTALCGLALKNIVFGQAEDPRANEVRSRWLSAFEPCRDVAWQRVPLPLANLRWQLGRAECSDDRDRIYAALDMLDYRIGIVPDYTMSAAQVFHNVTVWYFKHYSSAYILESCHLSNDFDPSSDHSSSLPSWVPNFAEPLPTFTSLDGYASGDLLGPRDIADCPDRGDNSILRIWGVPGDAVHEIANPYKEPDDSRPVNRLRSLLPALLPSSSFACGLDDQHPSQNGTVLEHYATALLGYTWLKENTAIENERSPSLENSVKILRTLLAYQDSQDCDSYWQTFANTVARLPDFNLFVSWVSSRLVDFRLALSPEQHVLLVPNSARRGDQACTLLGCGTTMLLRPLSMAQDEPAKYHLVGPCHISNMQFGDALLGRLPKGVRIFLSASGPVWTWLNAKNEIVSQHDPRMEALLEKLPNDQVSSYRERRDRTRNSWTGLEVDMKLLQKHRLSVNATGGDLQCFELV